ncbi:dihydropteroate synthase [Anditalea andensis]|uniref:dihydropteroate synthase n=1 Tax=Anditalea andensis TaxID=1048983 RepID=A0A074L114_9BACT|nr:dihydropteroate synthase [Anditalea andensis]KEO74854.1 dihydropteroate synthase [Anditalea andensis]
MTDNFISSGIEDILFPPKITLNIKGKLHIISQPWVMGILNVTPDSFYAHSRTPDFTAIKNRAIQIIEEGANIIDVGGYSTRPRAEDVSVEEEVRRVCTGIKVIREINANILISVDTFRAETAKAAVEAGAHIVNDVSGGNLDPDMIPTVGKLKAPYICMHMRGNPSTMTSLTEYNNIEEEILKYFAEKLNQCQEAGINDVVLDLGFGFAKSMDQNYRLLKNLNYFKSLNAPILVGVSRKSMIYRFLDVTPEKALNGTTALHMAALIKGANILRVHDVKEAVETVQLFKHINS